MISDIFNQYQMYDGYRAAIQMVVPTTTTVWPATPPTEDYGATTLPPCTCRWCNDTLECKDTPGLKSLMTDIGQDVLDTYRQIPQPRMNNNRAERRRLKALARKK